MTVHIPDLELSLVDAVVIGGGAAGLQAAIMMGRAGRSVVVVDAGLPRNRFAAGMHAVIGNEGTNPLEFAARGRRECESYGVHFVDARVENVEDPDGGDLAASNNEKKPYTLVVNVDDGQRIRARSIILATGITDRLPSIPGLAERWGTTVLHCPYCHGHEFLGQRLAVLGMGQAANHQATLVRQWSDSVVYFAASVDVEPERRNMLHARGVRIEDSPIVEISNVENTANAHPAMAVKLKDGKSVEVDAIFTAAQPIPHDGCVAALNLERQELPFLDGTFITTDPMGATSHKRVWAAGNVVNPMQNVPMALGMGSMAGAMANMALVEEDFQLAR